MKIVFFFGCMLGLLTADVSGQVDPGEIIENAVKKMALRDVRLDLEVETFDGKGNSKSRELNVSFALFDDLKKVLIEIMAPENVRGTRILTTDYPDKKGIIQVYMPSTGKIRKFRANNRRLKMAGSEIPINHFSVAAYADYEISVAETVTVDGVEYHKIKMNSPDENEFLIVYIRCDGEQLFRVESYDSQGLLTGVTELSDYFRIDVPGAGNFYPRQVCVKNLKNGKASNMIIREIVPLNGVKKTDFEL